MMQVFSSSLPFDFTCGVVFFFCHVKVYFYVVRFISLLLLLEFLVKIRKTLPMLRLYESSYVFLVSALFFYVRLSNPVFVVSRQVFCPWDFSGQEYWEWVAISSSGGSSRLKDGTHISCFGRQILYP